MTSWKRRIRSWSGQQSTSTAGTYDDSLTAIQQCGIALIRTLTGPSRASTEDLLQEQIRRFQLVIRTCSRC